MFGGRLGSEPSEQSGRLRRALLFVQTKALIQVVFHGTVDMLQYADEVVALVSIALFSKLFVNLENYFKYLPGI